MREGSRKRRIMIGLVSIPFFIVTSLGFGAVAQSNDNKNILGFSIGNNSYLSTLFPFSQVYAQSSVDYPRGEVINNVVLVDLKEGVEPDWTLDATRLSEADTVLNGATDSLKSYIHDISYGDVEVNSKIYTRTDGGFDAFQPTHDRSYYLNTTAPANATELERELLCDIIEQYKVKLATRTSEELDTNEDGYIDNVTFVIRGKKDSSHNLLWPHQFTLESETNPLPTVATTTGDLKFKDYNVILGGDSGTGRDVAGLFNRGNTDIGVIVHEFLHVYGFPDLYHNYKYDAEKEEFVPLLPEEQIGDPLGEWDIMDNTLSSYPQLPMVYTNKEYSPWGDNVSQLEVIDQSKTGFTLNKLEYKDGNKIAAILQVDAGMNPLAEDEYFMIEYRKQEGWDAKLPQSGLIVYRINTAANHKNATEKINEFCNTSGGEKHCGNMFGAPDEVFIFRPNATSITTGNTGSNTDPNLDNAAISPSNTRTTLGKTLAEVSSDNINVANLGSTIYFSDGSNSGIVVKNVVENTGDDTITFDIDFPQSTNDTKKPSIEEPTGNGLAGNWINGSPAISLYVSDEGRGIEKIVVTTLDGEIMDNGEVVKTITTTYSAGDAKKNVNFEFKANKNGTYKVIASDHAGNVSEEKIVNVTNIDHTLPEIVMGDATKIAGEMIMDVTFKDEDSQIDPSSAYYKTLGIKDSIHNLVYDQAISAGKIRVNETFQGKVCVSVKDYAGNAAKEPFCVVISNDKTIPEVVMNSSQDATSWSNTSVTILVHAKDDKDAIQTGVSTFEVTTTNGRIDNLNEKQLIKDNALAGTGSETLEFKAKANGVYKVNVCDYAQNCKETTYEVTNIDQDAPVISKINDENVKEMALFATAAHTISFEAHDEPVARNSGLKEIKYQFVGKDETYIEDITDKIWKTATIEETLTSVEGFEGKLYAYAIDNVGNISKIVEKEIKRVSNQLANEAFTSGIVDKSGKVNVIGIDDPDVTLNLNDVDVNGVKEKLGKDFLASYALHDVYDISLRKNGSSYTLANEVTIRFMVEDAIRNDGSLKLMGIDTDGKTQEMALTLGDSYVEFKTNTLQTFALVTRLSETPETSTTLISTPETGDESATLLHAMFIISMTSVLGAILKKKYETLNILDK